MQQFPKCPHFNACAGCSEHLSLNPPPLWEEMTSFFNPLLSKFHAGSPLHWRHRAKVAVRGSLTQPLIGLFKRFSHDVFPIPECQVHHPHLNQAFTLVHQWMQKNHILPYEEKNGKGDLRYLQGIVERSSGRIQLTFVFNSSHLKMAKIDHWRALMMQLANEHPTLWHSLWINFNDQPMNTIFGPEWIRVYGEELLWEKFENTDVCYGPASFGQANLPLFERMLLQIRALLPQQSRVAEFYAGVGVIGLFLASHCEWVRCSEINPSSEAYFQKSLTKLSTETSSRITFLTRSTQDALFLLEDATTVIVDPPRKGLDSCFFSALKEAPTVKQLIYISCGWEAFKKDFQNLFEEGWKVKNVDGYHFFPGSNHVELLVNFERNTAKR